MCVCTCVHVCVGVCTRGCEEKVEREEGAQIVDMSTDCRYTYGSNTLHIRTYVRTPTYANSSVQCDTVSVHPQTYVPSHKMLVRGVGPL